MHKDIVLTVEEKIVEEPSISVTQEVIKPETKEQKPALKNYPEITHKATLETTEPVNNSWKKPKHVKRPRTKTQEKKRPDPSEKPDINPKNDVRLGDYEDWTEYT